MKKPGILGGMGPESTLMYYKQIASEFQKRDENHFFPELTIETVNMYKMLGYCKSGDYTNLTGYLLKGIRNLESAAESVWRGPEGFSPQALWISRLKKECWTTELR